MFKLIMKDVTYITIALTAQLGAHAITMFTHSVFLSTLVDNVLAGSKVTFPSVRVIFVVSRRSLVAVQQ